MWQGRCRLAGAFEPLPKSPRPMSQPLQRRQQIGPTALAEPTVLIELRKEHHLSPEVRT